MRLIVLLAAGALWNVGLSSGGSVDLFTFYASILLIGISFGNLYFLFHFLQFRGNTALISAFYILWAFNFYLVDPALTILFIVVNLLLAFGALSSIMGPNWNSLDKSKLDRPMLFCHQNRTVLLYPTILSASLLIMAIILYGNPTYFN